MQNFKTECAEKENKLKKLSSIEKTNPALQETETLVLRLNVIKANTDSKIKRLQKLNENWKELEIKELEIKNKLNNFDFKHLVDSPIERDADLPVLQSRLVELKVRIFRSSLKISSFFELMIFRNF